MARQAKQNCDRIPPAPQSFRIKDNKNVNNKQETQGVILIYASYRFILYLSIVMIVLIQIY
jgi:hypothetical protein